MNDGSDIDLDKSSDRKDSWGKILDRLQQEFALVLHVRLVGDSIDHLGSIGFVVGWSTFQVLKKNYICELELLNPISKN